MDALAHLNNTVYFRYMENLRVQWMLSMQTPPAAQGIGPVIANTFCNFLRPLVFPGQVLAKLYITAPGRTSLDSYTTLEREDQPGILYATGGATLVWFNTNTQKSEPLPNAVRLALTST